MGEVIYVDFKNRRRVNESWLQEQERLFMHAMKDQDTPRPNDYPATKTTISQLQADGTWKEVDLSLGCEHCCPSDCEPE